MKKSLAGWVGGMVGLATLGSLLLAGDFSARLAELEKVHGGRLGVYVFDTGSGASLGYRQDERFAMCSTFKLTLAAAVLARVDAGSESLARRVPFGETDLLEYAPVTRERVAEGGLTVAELCAAMVEVSDNTAANLMLARVGGPSGFTAWLRSLGDNETRLDRTEPYLNTNLPGDPRDTTTPAAMARTLERVLTRTVLTPSSRSLLISWLERSVTGKTRLRAGFPAGWRVGDKTGSGPGNAYSDLAIAWPPGRPPLLVAVYYTGSAQGKETLDAVLAGVARLVAAWFEQSPPAGQGGGMARDSR